MATLMNRNLEGFLNKAIIMMQIDFQKFYQGPKLIKCPHISTFQAWTLVKWGNKTPFTAVTRTWSQNAMLQATSISHLTQKWLNKNVSKQLKRCRERGPKTNLESKIMSGKSISFRLEHTEYSRVVETTRRGISRSRDSSWIDMQVILLFKRSRVTVARDNFKKIIPTSEKEMLWLKPKHISKMAAKATATTLINSTFRWANMAKEEFLMPITSNQPRASNLTWINIKSTIQLLLFQINMWDPVAS